MPASEMHSSSPWVVQAVSTALPEAGAWLGKALLLPTWRFQDRPGGRLEPVQISDAHVAGSQVPGGPRLVADTWTL